MGYQLVQDVAVLGVDLDGDDVLVDVYGGPDHACASITYTFEDPAVRADNVARLRRWARATTPLTLVVSGSQVRLFSDRAVFGQALEPAAAD